VAGPWAWVGRRDPRLVVVRRAARVTLVACTGFFLCRYGLGNAAMAPYALFGADALGALPDPRPEPYTAKLARAVDALAGCLRAMADGSSAAPGRWSAGHVSTTAPTVLGADARRRPQFLPASGSPAATLGSRAPAGSWTRIAEAGRGCWSMASREWASSPSSKRCTDAAAQPDI
jgi:hypothetical protein